MSTKLLEGGKLGIMSDTHGSLPAWKAALSLFGDVDAILHAGDVIYHGPRNMIPGGYTPADLAEEIKNYKDTLLISRGNCDADVDLMLIDKLAPQYITAWWNGKKILMMHGDNFPLLRKMAFDYDADLAISGHTHIASLIREGNTIFLNPGSTTIPKGKDSASVAIVDENVISILTLTGEVLYSEQW
ncbi:MAG: phosphodiesterase [Synergistaceae bacterium]|nr:phosphodiesterase [Synergistaceae bacterium]